MQTSLHLFVLAFVAVLLGIIIAKFPDTATRVTEEGQPPVASLGLAPRGIDIRQTSVSGVSSGGAMAIQMNVANSAIMRGIGVFAGVGYDCADSRLSSVNLRLMRGLSCLSGGDGTDAKFSIDRTSDAAAVPGAIDPVSNLYGQKVWLFSGYNDGSVRREAMNAVAAYYEHYVDGGNVFYQSDNHAPHALVTDGYGGVCLGLNEQYINDCRYDAAGYLLKHIYGHLNSRSNIPTGSILAFDQGEFTGGVTPKLIGLAEKGYVYVPPACSIQSQLYKCRVHVVFHGCRQYAENPLVNKAVVEHGGYNEWADNNNLIVLYPQAVPTPAVVLNPGNPRGCWDWWGYSDLPRNREFARKTGYQIAAVKAMIDRLADGFLQGSFAESFGTPQNVSVVDKTSNSLELIWQANDAALGFNISRSSSATGPFVQIASMVKGASFTDKSLAQDTLYHYEIRAVDASNTLSPAVRFSGRTGAIPPTCDPYFSDNLTHVANLRAVVTPNGAVAVGSFDAMGPATDTEFRQLIKEGPAFYRARYCP